MLCFIFLFNFYKAHRGLEETAQYKNIFISIIQPVCVLVSQLIGILIKWYPVGLSSKFANFFEVFVLDEK